MARVYADVNLHMPKSYWEYDSVNITWGVLENYEVVRKIGRDTLFVQTRFAQLLTLDDREREILRGLRRHKRCQLPEMRYQGAEACEEEEDKARDQDSSKPVGGAQRRSALGCCSR